MFKLASMFVDIKADQSAFDRSLGGVHKQLSTAGVAVGTFVGNVATMFARIALQSGAGLFEKTIGSASHLNESISKTQAVFGAASSSIFANADLMATKFGSPKKAIIDATDSFGMLAKGAGKSGDASAEFGVKFAKMAADASSFFDVPLDQALEKLRSGLSGEAEPLRAFGVFLTEGAVAAEAMRLGLAKNSNEVSENAKIMARASLITNATSMKDAAGDLDRTLSSTENQTRKFWGTLENLGTSIGKMLIPVFDKLLAVASSTVTSIAAYWDDNADMFQGWIAAVRNIPTHLAIAAIKIYEKFINIGEYAAVIPENLSRIGTYIANNWRQLIVDSLTAVGMAFKGLGENLGNLGVALKTFATGGGWHFTWKPLLTEFKATADALPEMLKPTLTKLSTDTQEAALHAGENARDELAFMKDFLGIDLMASGGKTVKASADAADVAAKAKKEHESIGVAEFGTKMRLAQGAKDTPEKQLTELQMIRKEERENAKMIADAFARGSLAVLG